MKFPFQSLVSAWLSSCDIQHTTPSVNCILLSDFQLVLILRSVQQASISTENKDCTYIYIWPDDWQKNEALLKARLLAKCGISKKIFARQTVCVCVCIII